MIGDILGKPQSAYNANSGTVEVLNICRNLPKIRCRWQREHLGKSFSREFQALVRIEQQVDGENCGPLCRQVYDVLNSQMEKIESA